jgi:hypothetical protein
MQVLGTGTIAEAFGLTSTRVNPAGASGLNNSLAGRVIGRQVDMTCFFTCDFYSPLGPGVSHAGAFLVRDIHRQGMASAPMLGRFDMPVNSGPSVKKARTVPVMPPDASPKTQWPIY